MTQTNRTKNKMALNVVVILALLLNALGFTGLLNATPAQAQGGCPCSLWPAPITPGMTYDNPQNIEMGLKFRASVPGHVSGVRFFKAAGATGTHIGRLWTPAGVKLAEVTYADETASGWQTASFAEPVAIEADTTYIISYTANGVNASDRRFALTQNYFASSAFTNGPLRALQNGEDGPNGVYSDDGSFFGQSYNATNYWVDVIFDDTPDNTPPQISAISPTEGATDVLALANVSATFNEAMNAATISAETFELRGPGDTLIPAAVTYDAATHTAILNPTNALAFATVYTAKVKSGESGVKDIAGNALAADTTWSFTTESSDTTAPTVQSVSPTNGATEVALTTQVSAVFNEPLQPASITSAQFELRGPGASLVPASVAYNAGANTATLTPDAALTPGTAYTARIVSGPGNVLDLAGNPLAADYAWTFTTSMPPGISAVKPINGVTNLRLATSATVVFSRAMNPATINSTTFELRDAADALVPAQVSYNAADFSAVLDPIANLAYASTYTVKVKGGADGVKDANGLPLAADYTWSFSTLASRPAVDAAPGGPILIVADPNNLYTRYYTEILRTEGFNEFSIVNLPALDAATLAQYDVVLLSEMALSAEQVTMLSDYVTVGGNLIAMRPDKQLAALLGLADAAATVAEGYVRVITTSAPGRGITASTLQYHGTADAYTLNGATTLATLYSNRSTATTYPAATIKSVGSSGGQAAMFAYDLSRSIIYTHQGNPAWQTGHVNSYQDYGTALDLFAPDWIDFQRITIPQADEQQRFLSNLILHMNADKKPLPRFWYFPGGEKAAVILTGDDHNGRGSPSSSSQVFFDRHISQSPIGCSVDDWECVRSSSYGYTGALLTDAQAALYTAMGFEFGLHADAGLAQDGRWCGTWPTNMRAKYTEQFESLYQKYASIPVQGSERNHCYSWFGYSGPDGAGGAYASNAEVEDGLGIRFDTNISYNPASWATTNPGYQMGSGMMMRFAQVNPTGQMTGFLDIYNGGTQMNDDNGQGAAAMRTIIDQYLDAATGPLGYYGGFVVNMHSDNWYGWSYQGSDQIVQSAQAHSVPVVSGAQMVKWLDGRNSSSFSDIEWANSQLTFSISAAPEARNLRAMLPATFAGIPLVSISMNGGPVTFTTETIKGVEYAFFSGLGGDYTATYQPDTTPPVISAVSASVIDNQSAAITWTTNEDASSHVFYGTNPASLTLHVADTGFVTQHSLNLTGLLPNTTYYYRVRSLDGSGNTANWPVSGQPPLSFTTPSASFIDDTVADFSAGTPDANCAIVQDDDGEVILKPAFAAEFTGAALPAGWSKIAGAGTAAVADGKLTLDGATVGPATTLPAGQVLEARATFAAAPFQHIGFGVDYSAGVNDAWAIISTGSSGAGLLARSWNGSGAWSSETSTAIPGSFLGTPHLYRIAWLADKIEYYVDGNLVATHNLAITRQMRPMPADSTVGAPMLSVDWLRLMPYAPACTFTSRVMNGLGTIQTGTIDWHADLPTGTTLGMSVRSGDTADPDGTWTAFGPVTNGGPIPGGHTYLQYKADLATSDTNYTPALKDVRILFNRTPDTTPPTIVSRTPSASAANVDPAIDVVVQFSEAMNPASFSTGRFRLRAVGSGIETPASVTVTNAAATLHPSAPLALGVTYIVEIAGEVTDLAGNPLGTPASWTFTVTREGHFTDTTLAHFEAGTKDANLYLAGIDDGALMLAPAAGSEFFGPGLPTGWSTTPFSAGGTGSVANGRLTLDGARSGPNATFAPGRTLEGRLTFQAARYQHFGYAVNYMVDGTPWAIFSTGSNGDGLYARTFTGTLPYDTQITSIPASYLGSEHTYRIDWAADHFDYYVDGVLKATHTVAISTPMRPMPADSEVGGATIVVDWMRMTPYASPSTFISRIHDAGTAFVWQQLTWIGQQPADTTVGFETRSGNTATPDETWSAWQAVSGETIASPEGRYLQYRLNLVSSAAAATPVVEAVNIAGRLPDNDLPAVFDGWIDVAGTPPVIGDTVSAAIAGAAAPFTTIIGSEGGRLQYHISLPADAAGTPAKDGGAPGDEIVFTINGQVMAKAIWTFNSQTRLDFHPPLAEAQAALPALEASAVTIHADADHLGTDALTYEFDCGGDGTYEIGPQVAVDAACTYADSGSATAGVRITDAQGGQSADTVTFSVNNVAPQATWTAPASVAEGSDITISLTDPSDPSSADAAAGFEYAFDCGSGYGAWGMDASAACATTDMGSRNVAGKLRDKDGGEREYTASVTITNVAVTNASAGGPYTASAGIPLELTGSASCPAVDTCSYAWDLDDDGEYDDAFIAGPSYTWVSLGVFTIGLQVSDDDGSEALASTTVDVSTVIDPQILFTGRPRPFAMRLEWSTGSEAGLRGFNLYRSTTLSGARTKLNASLIRATGGATGKTYRYEDRTAQFGQTYFYWLEPIPTTGVMPALGPVTGEPLFGLALPAVKRAAPHTTSTGAAGAPR